MNKNKIIYSTLGSLSVVATTTAISVPLVISNIAKEKMESFVANGGSSNKLSKTNKINYVALGDSETSGYVGILGKDFRSYADFLSKSLKNADKLGNYHNFAIPGERLADVNKDIFESPDIVRVLKKADLISLTLGANDILAYLKILNIPFNQALEFISDQSKLEQVAENIATLDETAKKIKILPEDKTNSDSKNAYAALESLKPYASNKRSFDAVKDRTKIFGNNPNLGVNKEDSTKIFENSITDLQKLISGDKSTLFNLDTDWWPKIFDLIKRQYVILIRDLHKAAPNAQIRVLGHLFPFEQYDSDVYTIKKPEIDNNSILDGFNRMLSSMEEGSKTNIKGTSKFVKFENINKFKEIIDSKKSLNFLDEAKFKNSALNNPLPNITDIHPSVFGYSKIGEHLFKEIGKEIGLSNEDIKKFTQHSYPVNTQDDLSTKNLDESNWTRIDESDANLTNLYNDSKKIKSFTDMSDILLKSGQNVVIDKVFENMKKGSGEIMTIGQFVLSLLNPTIKPIATSAIVDMLKAKGKTITVDELSKNDSLFASTLNDIFSMLPSDPAAIKIALNTLNVNAILQKMIIPLKIKSEQLMNIINTSNILLKQLKEGEKNSKVTNETQWTLTQWGLATIFKNLFELTK